jgi:hypothetical protein
VLALLQAEAADRAVCSYQLATIAREVCLSAIFEHGQTVLAGEIDDRAHLAGIAEQMRDYDRLGLFAQACGDSISRDVAGERIDVGEHRNSSLVEDRRQCAHVGDRRRDDFVARFRIDRGNRAMNGRRAGRAGDRVLSPEQLGEAFLQCRAGRTFRAGKRAALNYLDQLRDFFRPEGPTGRLLIRRQRNNGLFKHGRLCHGNSPLRYAYARELTWNQNPATATSAQGGPRLF